MLKPWIKGGKVLVNNGGKVIVCDNCPCDLTMCNLGKFCNDPATVSVTFSNGGPLWAFCLNGLSGTLTKYILSDGTGNAAYQGSIGGSDCCLNSTGGLAGCFVWQVGVPPTAIMELCRISMQFYPCGSAAPVEPPGTFLIQFVVHSNFIPSCPPGISFSTCTGSADWPYVSTSNPVTTTLLSGTCGPPISFTSPTFTVKAVTGQVLTCITNDTLQVAITP